MIIRNDANSHIFFVLLAYFISAEDNKVVSVTFMWVDVMLTFMVDTQVDQKLE